MSAIESADDFVIGLIVEWLPSPLDVSLRATCRRIRALIPKPTPHSAFEVMMRSIDIGSIDLLNFALCSVKKGRVVNFDLLLRNAAMHDDLKMCLHMIQLGMERDGHKPNLTEMTKGAAEGGSRNLCILARNMSRGDEENCVSIDVVAFKMMRCAAKGCHADVCRLAHTWLAESAAFMDVDYEMCIAHMMRGIVSCSTANPRMAQILDLIREYCAKEDVNIEKHAFDLLEKAAKKGRADLCEFAISLFPLDLGKISCALSIAFEERNIKVCEWAVARGAQCDLDMLMRTFDEEDAEKYGRFVAENLAAQYVAMLPVEPMRAQEFREYIVGSIGYVILIAETRGGRGRYIANAYECLAIFRNRCCKSPQTDGESCEESDD